MSNLKPCPFCGSKNVGIDKEYDMDGFGHFHKVECRDCRASSKSHFVSRGNECPQHYQEVRDDWQSRPIEDQLAAENQALRKEVDELRAIIKGYRDIANDGVVY